jgi:hypothetical protein
MGLVRLVRLPSNKKGQPLSGQPLPHSRKFLIMRPQLQRPVFGEGSTLFRTNLVFVGFLHARTLTPVPAPFNPAIPSNCNSAHYAARIGLTT